MTEQTCTSCAWWADLGDSIGQCRRHAPRPRTSTDEVVWPTTDSDDYCGEWEEADTDCDCDDDETCELCEPDDVDSEFADIIARLDQPPKQRRRWLWQRKG
jgi:hypothetical protein